MEDEEGEARGGTSRRRIARRASIFIGPAAIAQASAALPSGPTEPGFYWASLAVFVLCALSMLLPWPRFPRWTVLVPTLGYLVSVTLLLISGGTDRGHSIVESRIANGKKKSTNLNLAKETGSWPPHRPRARGCAPGR